MKIDATEYGKDLGAGIKEGLKGINTVASPKKKKVVIKLMSIPFIAIPLALIGGMAKSDFIIGSSLIPILCSGLYQFYIGNFKKGLLFTFTIGLCYIGILIDLFKLKITGTLTDSNGFPIIY